MARPQFKNIFISGSQSHSPLSPRHQGTAAGCVLEPGCSLVNESKSGCQGCVGTWPGLSWLSLGCSGLFGIGRTLCSVLAVPSCCCLLPAPCTGVSCCQVPPGVTRSHWVPPSVTRNLWVLPGASRNLWVPSVPAALSDSPSAQVLVKVQGLQLPFNPDTDVL